VAWDLTIITDEPLDEIVASIKLLRDALVEYEQTLQSAKGHDGEWLAERIDEYQRLAAACDKYSTLPYMQTRIDPTDEDAKRLTGHADQLEHQLDTVHKLLVRLLHESDAKLPERSETIARKLLRLADHTGSPEQEAILGELPLMSSKRWQAIRDFVLTHETSSLGHTVHKAQSMMTASDAATRQAGYDATNEVCVRIAPQFSQILQGIKTESQVNAKYRGYASVLEYRLERDGLSMPLLDGALTAVDSLLPALQTCLQLKAKRLGHDSPMWFDTQSLTEAEGRHIGFEEALRVIRSAFMSFGIDGDGFDTYLGRPGLIDHEERPNKRGGAATEYSYSSGLAFILLTYNDTLTSFTSLAHELGHALLFHHLREKPFSIAFAPNTVSEMMAIFSELLCTKELIEADPGFTPSVVEARTNSYFTTFMHVYSRYLFEKKLFSHLDGGGFFTDGELSAMMLEAERQTIGEWEEAAAYQVYEWVTKPHFYYVDRPYYNFSYLIGRLGAYKLFAEATSEWAGRTEELRGILADSGSVTALETMERLFAGSGGFGWDDALGGITTIIAEYASVMS